jgi:hypothetical protein
MRLDLSHIRSALTSKDKPVLVDEYTDDPVRFAEEFLGVSPWSRQAEMLRAVALHQRVAVRSGHKVSKSHTVAILALWWVCTRPGGRCILTAPTTHQVDDVLWKELRRLHRKSKRPIGGTCHRVPSKGLQFGDGREVLGFSTDQPERMSGISGEHLLFIADEASGIDESIFEALEGNRAGGARILLCSNPTRTSGTFWDVFTRQAEHWHCLHISSEESPNVTAGKTLIPGLATIEWVAEKRREWGIDSAQYMVRVLGNFPTHASNSIIGLSLVEAAQQRYSTLPDPIFPGDIILPRLRIGVDVARFGDDDTVIQMLRGHVAFPAIALHGLDAVQVAGKVMELAREQMTFHHDRHSHETRGMVGEVKVWERPLVAVDVIGVGAGVFDILARHDEIEAVAINVAESATVENYQRLRDQLWFGLREWLRTGAIPADQRLAAELVCPTYTFSVTGKIVVESKDAMKLKLKRSPDRADALALAVYQPPDPPVVSLGDPELLRAFNY